MVTTNSTSPFAANSDYNGNGLQRLDTTTHSVTEKSSATSLASATMIASTTSTTAHEKAGRLSTGSTSELHRPSDLSDPPTAHNGNNNPFETDIEAMITQTNSQGEGTGMATNPSRKSITCRGLGDSQVWPGKNHWKKKAKEQKNKRSRTCLSRLSKRNRLIVKMLIGLLIIGIAVGVGFGISKPLGASIWGQKKSD